MATIIHKLLSDLPEKLPEEELRTLLSMDGVRVERIVSTGHASPPGFWYEQVEHEWVTLIAGSARLTIEGEEPLSLRPGDSVFLPAQVRHRVDWTSPSEPTVWLAVFWSP